MTEDTRNHVVPCYDAFIDGFVPHIQFIVMPVMRRFDDPPFWMASEVMDFVTQVLEVNSAITNINQRYRKA